MQLTIRRYKNTINMKYLLGFLWLQTNVFIKISAPPPSSSAGGSFATIARDFQIIFSLALAALILNVLRVVFFFFREGLYLLIS